MDLYRRAIFAGALARCRELVRSAAGNAGVLAPPRAPRAGERVISPPRWKRPRESRCAESRATWKRSRSWAPYFDPSGARGARPSDRLEPHAASCRAGLTGCSRKRLALARQERFDESLDVFAGEGARPQTRRARHSGWRRAPSLDGEQTETREAPSSPRCARPTRSRPGPTFLLGVLALENRAAGRRRLALAERRLHSILGEFENLLGSVFSNGAVDAPTSRGPTWSSSPRRRLRSSMETRSSGSACGSPSRYGRIRLDRGDDPFLRPRPPGLLPAPSSRRTERSRLLASLEQSDCGARNRVFARVRCRSPKAAIAELSSKDGC